MTHPPSPGPEAPRAFAPGLGRARGQGGGGADREALVEPAVALVRRWLVLAASGDGGGERSAERLRALLEDPDGLAFALAFCDRVLRADDPAAGAEQLRALVRRGPRPSFLSPLDRGLLWGGAVVGPVLPRVVLPLARRRLRALVGHLVGDARPARLGRHLALLRGDGFEVNVNLLGEAVLGEEEAVRRRDELIALVRRPEVDHISVKVSAVASRLDLWAAEDSVGRIVERLRPVLRAAATTDPPTFVDFDMESYGDLHLTVEAFRTLLDEPGLASVGAGLALQAYLPDSFDVVRTTVAWAEERYARTGGRIKVRLVKGANLAMERVDAALHGWPLAPYPDKAAVDANYKRLLDWLTGPDRTDAVRIGVASHNLFDVAWAHLLARQRGVSHRVEFEALQGMAPAQARVVRDAVGGLRLYTPVVAPAQLDVAVSYLFRRLEENTAPENFLRHLFTLVPGSLAFEDEVDRFRAAVATRWDVPSGPNRRQLRQPTLYAVADRQRSPTPDGAPAPSRSATVDEFRNEPDTDPSLAENREWARALVQGGFAGPSAPIVTDPAVVDEVVARAAAAQRRWAREPAAERRRVLYAVAAELAARRGELVRAMVHETGKTVAEADPEVSEAVDFARWYGDRALELERIPGARFESFGVVVVAPPWNFPVSIPAGGVLAALAAGNAAIAKPAPEAPACAEAVLTALWAAGVPPDLAPLLRVPDGEVGRHLISHPGVGAVVLTGSWETAQLFRRWRPERPLLAETSGKNAVIITPNADLDLAVADLVRSAFGHAGQKCSAASLAICVGSVATSPRFRRQLIDATRSLVVGPATDLATAMGPLITPPGDKLRRGLTELERGQSWLVRPNQLDSEGRLWSPGIRDGVLPGSAFHQTEYFGPVLGLMAARDLDQAIEWANAQPYGLTGGIHTLDPTEIERWLERIEVGNAYVNRHTTGAIVRRQPFGGWKRSSVGAGCKAGGPNHLLRLGRWAPAPASEVTAGAGRISGSLRAEVVDVLDRLGPGLDDGDRRWVEAAAADDERWWQQEYGVEHDPTGLFCEANVLRYRPRSEVVVRAGEGSADRDLARVLVAVARTGASVHLSASAATPVAVAAGAVVEDDRSFAVSLADRPDVPVRHLGAVDPVVRRAAVDHGVDLVEGPALGSGRLELLWCLREQAISRTLHRYGNLVGATPARPGPSLR